MTELLDFPDEPLPDLSLTVPTPSFAQIEWLKRNVRALGGVSLSKVCRPRGIAYPAEDGVRTVMVNTQGCGNETMALIPYEKPDGSGGSAEVCLVCDGFIEWPRSDGEEATGDATEPPPMGDLPNDDGRAWWTVPRP